MKFFFSSKVGDQTVEKSNMNKYDISQYDDTYAVPRVVQKLLGLRLTCQDSTFVKFCWDLFYWFSFLNLLLATFLELINMAQSAQGGTFQDAVEIFRMMPCVGYLLMAMTKSYKIVNYRPVYENLVSELRGMWPVGTVDEEEHIVMQRTLKQLKIAMRGYYWCNNVLLLIFMSPPCVEIIKMVTGHESQLILPFFYWFPFDPFQRGYYEFILVWQTWQGSVAVWYMLYSDLLFCIFIGHITMQFDLLSVKIRKLIYVSVDSQLPADYPLGDRSLNYLRKDRSRVDSFTYLDWEKSHQKALSSIILRHRVLIRLAGDVENMFSFTLLVNFFNSSIILCFCGFCAVMVEKWNEMVYKTFLMTAQLQMFLLCWYGQRLLDASKGVSESLYHSGWYQAAKAIKSCIFIMIQRSQKEVHVTTYGFSVICLASYTTIIKSAWSYFTLLLNIYK